MAAHLQASSAHTVGDLDEAKRARHWLIGPEASVWLGSRALKVWAALAHGSGTAVVSLPSGLSFQLWSLTSAALCHVYSRAQPPFNSFFPVSAVVFLPLSVLFSPHLQYQDIQVCQVAAMVAPAPAVHFLVA